SIAPIAQPSIEPRVRRQTSPAGAASDAGARARPCRWGTIPSPRSRIDCTATATTARTAPRTTPSNAGQTVFSSYGRVFSAHPNGESHASQLLRIRVRSLLGVPSALPRPATTKVTTSIQTANEFAPRDVRISWATRRPAPRKTRPTEPVARPDTLDPAAGYPEAVYARATRATSTAFAMRP